jgi:ABC-type multidrug transport system ATPase subunit/pSer/pThr/pTyr-binding forkhead associated (FHA) protein
MMAAITVRVRGQERTLDADSTYVIGRGRDADIEVADELVSRRHASLQHTNDGWQITDLGSTNGLWLGDSQVRKVAIGPGPLTVRLGGPEGVVLLLTPVVADRPEGATGGRPTGSGLSGPPDAPRPFVAPRSPNDRDRDPGPGLPFRAVFDIGPGVTGIGRARSNGVVLGDLLVSRAHAQLRATPKGIELRDLGSSNGTFVNGRAIDRCVLAHGDVIAIGPHTLRFDGARLLELDHSGGIAFGAAHLSAEVDGTQLLQDVSFSLGPRSLMAVVGPSGAGKSTLLNALAGLRQAASGQVLYAGRDLYTQYAELRQRIGFVPQQDILHQVLTVGQALGLGARLRFPADTAPDERAHRMREVAAELSLTDRLDTRISSLSGGERKRASTAMELLTKPSLLFLDEPTSGLDTDLDRDVMHLLRALADDGRTVVIVTHNLEHLAVCDVVMVLARGGNVAFLGPPTHVFEYFGVASWADLFGSLKTRESREWAARFRGWTDRDTRAIPAIRDGSRSSGGDLTPLRPKSAASQMVTLGQRQLAVTTADRALLAILTLLPTVLALIARVIPGTQGLAHQAGNPDASQLLLVLVVGASLMGAAGSVRELVKERSIYQRERAVGLSSAAYLASKVIVLTTIGAVQGAVLTILALFGRPPAREALLFGNPTLELAIVVAGVTAVSTLLGLVISAAVKDENQAMPLLVLVSMAQLVMCGGLVPVAGRAVLDQLSWLLPSRWGFAAAAATVDLPFLRADPSGSDPWWKHSAPVWLFDIGALAALGIIAVALTAVLLRRLDPHR